MEDPGRSSQSESCTIERYSDFQLSGIQGVQGACPLRGGETSTPPLSPQ
jgi:hypothetical protein